MTTNEVSPYRYFSRTLDLWWLVFIAMLIGGALGFAFFYFHPPLYEATATYDVSIDLAAFPLQGFREDLIIYNEDMAVNITQEILISDEVIRNVLSQLNSEGIPVSIQDLFQNYTIERKHDVWELRYRSQVPANAQAVVNTWAEIGYQAMLSWKASGKTAPYVVFQSPTQALLPTEPVIYGRNSLMLAGALIGLIVGILCANRLSHAGEKPSGV